MWRRHGYRSLLDVPKDFLLRSTAEIYARRGNPPVSWPLALHLRKLPDPVYLRVANSDFLVLGEIFDRDEYAQIKNWDLPKDARVVDLGANIGLASVYFASFLPDAHVVAVEPDEENCRLIKKNCRRLLKDGRLHVLRRLPDDPVHRAARALRQAPARGGRRLHQRRERARGGRHGVGRARYRRVYRRRFGRTELHHRLHSRIAECARCGALSTVIEQTCALSSTWFCLLPRSVAAPETHRHRDLVKTLTTCTPEEAAAFMGEHVRYSEHEALERLKPYFRMKKAHGRTFFRSSHAQSRRLRRVHLSDMVVSGF